MIDRFNHPPWTTLVRISKSESDILDGHLDCRKIAGKYINTMLKFNEPERQFGKISWIRTRNFYTARDRLVGLRKKIRD